MTNTEHYERSAFIVCRGGGLSQGFRVWPKNPGAWILRPAKNPGVWIFRRGRLGRAAPCFFFRPGRLARRRLVFFWAGPAGQATTCLFFRLGRPGWATPCLFFGLGQKSRRRLFFIWAQIRNPGAALARPPASRVRLFIFWPPKNKQVVAKSSFCLLQRKSKCFTILS